MKGHYGPGRFECTAPVIPATKDKFMFRPQQPGEMDAEYKALERAAQERFNRLQGRRGGLEKARKSGPSMTSDLDEEQPYNK
jgi:hypothetical protein